MATITCFSDEWYHGIISQTIASFGSGVTPDTIALAKSIMVAGCCISQALDHMSKEGLEANPAGDVADAISRLADVINEKDFI